MRTRNAMQLKAVIGNRAKEGGVPPQLVMQSYLLERLLERISLSPWRDSVVVKGGVLISSLVGVDRRSTKDLDATVRGFLLTHESAERAFREIAAVVASDAAMRDRWAAYARRYPYVGDMTLAEACETVVAIMKAIGW